MSSSHDNTGWVTEFGDPAFSEEGNEDSNDLTGSMEIPSTISQQVYYDLYDDRQQEDPNMFSESAIETCPDINSLMPMNEAGLFWSLSPFSRSHGNMSDVGSWNDSNLDPHIQGLDTTIHNPPFKMCLPDNTDWTGNELLESSIGTNEPFQNASSYADPFQPAFTSSALDDSTIAPQLLDISHDFEEVNQTQPPFQAGRQ